MLKDLEMRGHRHRAVLAPATEDMLTMVPPPTRRMCGKTALSAAGRTLIVWIASAPRDVVLNEAIITPIAEHGWP